MLILQMPKWQPKLLYFTLLTTSSMQREKRYGDRTPPCLTPHFKIIKLEKQFPHLIQVEHEENQYSNVKRRSLGILLSINLIKRA
jgi:hypothetical protein